MQAAHTHTAHVRLARLSHYSVPLVVDSVTAQMLEPLVHLLVSNDVEVQKAATLAISNLALHGPGKMATV